MQVERAYGALVQTMHGIRIILSEWDHFAADTARRQTVLIRKIDNKQQLHCNRNRKIFLHTQSVPQSRFRYDVSSGWNSFRVPEFVPAY